MPDNHEASIERMLGRMEKAIENLTQTVEEQKVQSSEGRRRIYSEMEAVRNEAVELRADITAITEKFAKAEKVLDFVERWKERAIGMVILWSVLAAAFGAAVATFWKWVLFKMGLG